MEGVVMKIKLSGRYVLLVTLFITGCTSQQGQQEQAGMIIGGLLGGALGSQIGDGDGRTAAIIAGTLAGSAIGGSIGRTMDDVDRANTAGALETVRTGVSSRWKNPDSGHSYSVTPTRTYEVSAEPCREYTIDAMIGGQEESVYGTACRQRDGSWMIQN